MEIVARGFRRSGIEAANIKFPRRTAGFGFDLLASLIRNRAAAFRVKHAEEAVPSFTREDLLAARLRLSKVVPYQRSTTPLVSNLSLAICSGLLLIFAFPEWNLWSLAWVGAAPLIMALAREQRFWKSILLGTVTGTVFYVGTSNWVTYSMHNYGGIALWLSYLIASFVALLLGIFTGLFAGVVSIAVRRLGGWGLLTAPVVWPATEWARLKLTGMGWNALGYSQAFHPVVIQVARWGGVYAVSALLVIASTALVFGVIYLERRRGFIVFSLASVIIISAVASGQLQMPPQRAPGSVSVVVVQPDIPITDRWDDPQFVDEVTSQYVSLSEQAIQSSSPAATAAAGASNSKLMSNPAHDGRVALVIWPEAQVNFEYDRDLVLQRRLAEFTRRNLVYLLINSWGYPDNAGPRNSAMVISPSGDKTTEYDKIALMPFGEYVPARGFIPFMDRIPALVADVTPGSKVTLADVSGARVGTFICFEATRPEIARQMRRAGASALVQISNEAWFGPTAAARQVLAHAVFRAVENSVDLIRATNSGLSARIDRYGLLEGVTPMFEPATRQWRISTTEEAAPEGTTFYTRHGDVFAVVCLILSAVVGVAGALRLGWKGGW